MGGIIAAVEKDSPAERAGLMCGDEVTAINGIKVCDMLDISYYSSSDNPSVLYVRDGKEHEARVLKTEEEALGIAFEDVVFDKVRSCRNKCDFCFVDQDPRDARKSMQIKDDDYRLSLFAGNFVTLTNMSEDDWKKIELMRPSPLYVSVHATDPEVRVSLMKNLSAGKIMEELRRLADLRISVNAQIVLCPGINDGKVLEKTLQDLGSLYPFVSSVAIVPVGLTKYHKPNRVRSFSKKEMENAMEIAIAFSNNFVSEYDDTFVYLADEFFIKTGNDIPPAWYYGDFPQLENGIGMTRIFLDGMRRDKRYIESSLKEPRKISIITGKLAYGHIKGAASLFEKTANLELRVQGAESVFWGPSVDVAGLLTGADIVNEIKTNGAFDEVIIPSHCLRNGELFLDGMSVRDVEQEIGKRIIPVSPDFPSLRKEICGRTAIRRKKR